MYDLKVLSMADVILISVTNFVCSLLSTNWHIAQSARAVEYTDCFSAAG